MAENPPPPFAPGEAGADDYLRRALALVERAIRRRWAEGLLTRDPDGVFTSFLGAEDIERLMKPRPAGNSTAAPPPLPEFRLDGSTPLGQLIARLALSPSQADVLAVLLAAEVDPSCARLLTYLGGNQAQFSFTVDLLFDVVYRGRSAGVDDAAAQLHLDLAPHSWLRRLRFLLLEGEGNRMTLAQGIRLHPRIARWLLRQRDVDADLAALCQLHPPQPPLGECAPDAFADAVAAFSAGERLLLVEGPLQSGREMLLRFAAAHLSRPLFVVSGQGLGPDRLVAAFREAFLHGALLCFREAREVLEGDCLLRFREVLPVYKDTIALIGAERAMMILGGQRPATTIRVDIPPHGERLRLWSTYLGGGAALSPQELQETAALYNLGTAGIVRASQSARETARFAGTPVGRAQVALAVRQLFEADLAAVATRAEVSQSWDDLVLPEDLGESILSFIDRIRFRGDVLGEWGFARKLGKGLGLTALFSGEPGTGKSMVAGLIAKELGLDLYVIDLSRITSKWLGETEKNLGRAFDAAEAGHVLLLFDEADTILGKRSSDIRSSNDRYANLETNFILARIEQFQGIAIFTTNLPSAIDPAMLRRMSVQIHFPFPDLQTRTELWARMLPAEAPVRDDIDYEGLAARFELSGGFIRNIVLRAAYAAAREGAAIGTAHLTRAAELEYRERGSLLVGGRLV